MSETALGRGYCGARPRSLSPDGEYTIGSSDPRESFESWPVDPESPPPWLTPWRIIVVGDVKTIADLPAHPPVAGPEPGKASWSRPLPDDDRTNFEVQMRFIDYAADLGWRDCLIDALWDEQIAFELELSILTLACLELQKAM